MTHRSAHGSAALLLVEVRGTIDNESEDIDDALAAVDHDIAVIEHEHSFVVTEGDRVVAMAFVVADSVHYVDPIVMDGRPQADGSGRTWRMHAAELTVSAGVTEVGATITDGNTASDRLFLGLGFARRGPWV